MNEGWRCAAVPDTRVYTAAPLEPGCIHFLVPAATESGRRLTAASHLNPLP